MVIVFSSRCCASDPRAASPVAFLCEAGEGPEVSNDCGQRALPYEDMRKVQKARALPMSIARELGRAMPVELAALEARHPEVHPSWRAQLERRRRDVGCSRLRVGYAPRAQRMKKRRAPAGRTSRRPRVRSPRWGVAIVKGGLRTRRFERVTFERGREVRGG